MNKFIKRLSNIDEVKIMQVIEIKSLIGKGTPEDVCRQLIEYYDMAGNLLARYDSWSSNLDTVLFEEEMIK
jgi:hypothetical protein